MKAQKKIRVVVTGATGFLGGNILKALMTHSDIEPIAACRRRDALPRNFNGEVRTGDLLDAKYRREVVKHVDVVCSAGNWASMWNHKDWERQRFFEPGRDLIEQAVQQGVKRFIQTSSVVIGAVAQHNESLDDFSETKYTGFWPHLDYTIDLDRFMRDNSQRGTQMVTMRLGHFIGAGNRLGMLPALVPRLKTYLVPWLAGGRKRLPLVADTDLGKAFALATVADNLNDYESFNICGAEFPTLREVIQFISTETGCPQPLYSVPYPAGYAFGWLMEKLKPVMPGSSPFLTRSIVHLCENWVCPSDYAQRKIGYLPKKDWHVAAREHLADLKTAGYPWPHLCQPA
ncbi:MAG: NAD-dependent epimerase/dehydratase family protein [Gammaproteobacteria bacterium]|nr:NAD-dependent epimerase/dehydratase family protein [Gammaproteobacteria bacterium]